MARDNSLPFADALSHVSARTRAPVVPAVVIGVLAVAILILNVNLPNLIEMLCAVAIVWANLAYLMVTFPLLLARLRRNATRSPGPAPPDRDCTDNGDSGTRVAPLPYFSLGRLGLPVNVIAVLWGLFVVVNIGWPRSEIYGSDRWGRFAAPLATLALFVPGATYFLLFQRTRTAILAKHAAEPISDVPAEPHCNLQVAGGQWSVVSGQ
jgi:amino acid transporter